MKAVDWDANLLESDRQCNGGTRWRRLKISRDRFVGLKLDFAAGRVILALLLISGVCGIVIVARPSERRGDLVIWTFDPSGVNPRAIQRFEIDTGKSVSVKLISTRALDTRLLSQFMSPHGSMDSPDLVEIEIGSIGKFLRPPVAEIGFLPLNADLQNSGLDRRLLASRLMPWTKDSVVFGLPQDVHPVTLTYRKDLFDAAGIDLTRCVTWTELQRSSEQFEQFWTAKGVRGRHALMLSAAAADDLIVMLQQRHISLLDSVNGVHLAEPSVAQTVLFYAGLVAGNHAVAGEPGPEALRWADDVADGDLCMLFTPDWRVNELKSRAPSLAGKLGMIPLPRFDPHDSPTGSWGGTMIGLPRAGHHLEQAWTLAVALTDDPPAGVLPALTDRWTDEAFHRPDPFFSSPPSVEAMYAQLAAALPPRTVTSFSAMADSELAEVLRQAIALQREHPERDADDPGSMQQCMKWLATAADDLHDRIRLGTF